MEDFERLIKLKEALKESGYDPKKSTHDELTSALVVYEDITNPRTELILHPDFSPSPNKGSLYEVSEIWKD